MLLGVFKFNFKENHKELPIYLSELELDNFII